MLHDFYRIFMNHYFVVLSVVVYMVIAALVMVMAVWVRQHRWVDILGEFVSDILALFLFLMAGVLTAMSVYKVVVLCTMPYATDVVEQFDQRVRPDTAWVKDGTTIFLTHGGGLMAIKPDGRDRHEVFRTAGWIRFCRFSPDGRYLATVTDRGLLLFDRTTKTLREVERLPAMKKAQQGAMWGAVVRGLAWAPDSRKLVYRVMTWSPVASQSRWMLYDVAKRTTESLSTASVNTPELYWGADGQALYGMLTRTLVTALNGDAYQISVYRFAAPLYKPVLFLQFPYASPEFPVENLALRGIKVVLPRPRLAFGPDAPVDSQTLDPRGRLTVDKEGYLVLHSGEESQRRLFRIPCVPTRIDSRNDILGPRRPVLSGMKWLPGGRYAVMKHPFFGILVLDTATRRIGILDNARDDAFGWYTPPGN